MPLLQTSSWCGGKLASTSACIGTSCCTRWRCCLGASQGGRGACVPCVVVATAEEAHCLPVPDYLELL
jgi:hypothetical protein